MRGPLVASAEVEVDGSILQASLKRRSSSNIVDRLGTSSLRRDAVFQKEGLRRTLSQGFLTTRAARVYRRSFLQNPPQAQERCSANPTSGASFGRTSVESQASTLASTATVAWPSVNISVSTAWEDTSTTTASGDEDETARALATAPQRGAAVAQRRCSQSFFAEPSQTVIILDYDDTLFPTSRLREVGVPLATPIHRLVAEHPDNEDVLELSRMIADCEREAVAFLRLCARLSAGVHLVTLAKRGWVEHTCKNIMPALGRAFEELGIPILYAREYDQDCQGAIADSAAMGYWSSLKRAAIDDCIAAFYKQYPGQTWKNIVSIGDADYEREATRSTIASYFSENVEDMHQASPAPDEGVSDMTLVGLITPKTAEAAPVGFGSEVGGQSPKLVKIRGKTVTLLDCPTLEELRAQIALLRAWLGPLVRRESGMEIRLISSSDDDDIQRLHRELTGQDPEGISWRALGGLDAEPGKAERALTT